MRKYLATVKDIQYYEIGFESPDFKQALLDAETILATEYFDGEFIRGKVEGIKVYRYTPKITRAKEDRKIVGVRHNDL